MTPAAYLQIQSQQRAESREAHAATTAGEVDLPPAAKKQKVAEGSNRFKTASEDGVDEAIESAAQAPRNAVEPAESQPATSLLSDLSISGSAESYYGGLIEHESLQADDDKETPPEATAKDEQSSSTADHNSPSTPSVRKPATQKRKAVRKTTATAKEDVGQGNDTSPTSAKKAKRISPKTAKKSGSSSPQDNATADAAGPSSPPPKELSFRLAWKVRRVHEFLAAVNEDQTLLRRSQDNKTHIHIPELTLLGVLMRFYIDYELGDPQSADIADVEEASVGRYTAPVHPTAQDSSWIIFNTDAAAALETLAQEKVYGHGLEGVNLMEMEMEMHAREPSVVLSDISVLNRFYVETWRKVNNGIAHARLVQAVRNECRVAMELANYQAVCPAPMVDA